MVVEDKNLKMRFYLEIGKSFNVSFIVLKLIVTEVSVES